MTDHYFSAFSRGKSENPTETPDDGYFEGALEAYMRICNQIQTIPKAEQSPWMLEFDASYYREVESLRDEITDRRHRLVEENQVTWHECTGLFWNDNAWVSK